tara:strand:- start:216 stop:515 length:300 start_codon:yes stop_codon:yes gene_type:complete
MSKIQNIDSTPEYIGKFLRENMDQLIHIHDEGMEEHKTGCLGFKCSQTDNKMDVFFMTEEIILQMLQKESWEQLKGTINDKKLFLINDLDKNSIFLVYV